MLNDFLLLIYSFHFEKSVQGYYIRQDLEWLIDGKNFNYFLTRRHYVLHFFFKWSYFSH